MTDIDVNPNPVGVAQQEVIDTYVDKLKKIWDENWAIEQAAWWKFWHTKFNVYAVVRFLIDSLDGVINAVESIIALGPDKKATVMGIVAAVYDYIIAGALPIWLKPFSGKIRSLILNVIVSLAIDWIVGKYRLGAWKKE